MKVTTMFADDQGSPCSALGSHLAKMHYERRATPYVANRALAITSKLLSWCERQGLRSAGSNPALGIEKYRESKRERFLSGDELSKLGTVLKVCEISEIANPFVIAAIRLCRVERRHHIERQL